jgi:inner membrane protein
LFFLGHLGISLGIAYILEKRFLRNRLGRIDYRFLLVGSMIPDIIDKPLSVVGLIGGRSIAHTLVFALTVTCVTTCFGARKGKSAIGVVLSLGVWLHLLLDMMWEMPEVILWPALGFAFPVYGFDLGGILENLVTNPYVFGGEILGAVLLIAFIVKIRISGQSAIRRFLGDGLIN